MNHAPAAPDTLAAFEPLNDCEREMCRVAPLGGSVRPPGRPAGPADVTVRAALLRLLAIERDPTLRLHESGLRLVGMIVDGDLDLGGCEVRRGLSFERCGLRYVGLFDARLGKLAFENCRIGRLAGDRGSLGALFLRDCIVEAGVHLMGVRIEGDLDCSKSRLSAQDPADPQDFGRRQALALDNTKVGGAFFLRDARIEGGVTADSMAVAQLLAASRCRVERGRLAMHSATIGGDFELDGAVFSTQGPGQALVRPASLLLAGARIGGSLLMTAGFEADAPVDLSDARIAGHLGVRGACFRGVHAFAIVAQRLAVDGVFDLDPTTRFVRPAPSPGAPPALDFTAATLGGISCEGGAWPRGNRVHGLRYGGIVGATPTRARWWIDWLQRQVPEDLAAPVPEEGGDAPGPASAPLRLPDSSPGPQDDPATARGFKPQPWDQVILALRQAGCHREAEDVAIAKERAQHAGERGPVRLLRALWDVSVRFGYRPLRLLWLVPVVWAISGVLFEFAADAGVMAPTDDKVLSAAEFAHCRPERGGNWARCALAPAYPDFHPWAYAAQAMAPVLELRQAKDWAPVPWIRPTVSAPAAIASAASSPASSPAPASAEPELAATPRTSTLGLLALRWSWFESAIGLGVPALVVWVVSGLVRRKAAG
ncbi:MAG: hypothetical protein ACTHL8_22010 [Burkholderiaceae bacterium]